MTRPSRRTRLAPPTPHGLLVALLLGVTGTLISYSAALAAGERVTLADVVASALHESARMHIAELEAGQAKDAFAGQRSDYLPQLSVTSGAGYSNRQNEKLRAVDSSGQEKTYGLQSIGARDGWFNVEVQQLLVDLGSWHRIEQQALAAEAAAARADEQRDATTYEVLLAYINVLKLEELQALADAHARQATWLDEQATILLRAGRAVATEREQTAVAAGEAALELQQGALDLAEARAALQSAIGDGTLDVSHLDPTSLPVADLPPAELTSDGSLAQTPALRVLDLRCRAEEQGLSAARAEHYPTVGLRAGYSNYGPNRYDNYPDEASVHVAVRVPLFDSGRASSATASAAKALEIAQIRYRTALADARARMQTLMGQLVTGRERAALAVRRADLTRERVRLSDLNLQGQRGTLAEAETARAAFEQQSTAAVQARYGRLETWAALMREGGQLVRAILGERTDTMASPTR